MGRKYAESDESNSITSGQKNVHLESANRRTFLRATAGAAVGTAGLGVMGSSAIAEEEYGEVLDIVDDLGADNTGEEPINDALATATESVEYDFSHYAAADGWPMPAIDEIDFDDDGVKVVFPPGEYVIDEGPNNWGFARWGLSPQTPAEQQFLGKLALVGEGDQEATLRTVDDGRYTVFTLWGRDIRIENFTVDHTPFNTSTGITGQGSEKLLIKDIHFDGKVTGDYVQTPHPNDDSETYNDLVLDDPNCIGPGVFGRDGTGIVENVSAPDGVESLSRKGGSWVTFHHAGDLLYRNCEFSYFADNAIYASAAGQHNGQQGSVRVENSLFRNNNVTAIRLGSPGSYAKNCTVITEAGEIPATPWGAITSRAGWVWNTFDGYYKNITVINDHPSGEGILDHPIGAQDIELDVTNCRMEINVDGRNAIRYNAPGVDQLSVKNLHVTGAASDGAALNVGNCDATIKNVCITQSGDNRDGISVTNVTGSIKNARIDVTGDPLVEDEESDVAVENFSNEGECAPATVTDPRE